MEILQKQSRAALKCYTLLEVWMHLMGSSVPLQPFLHLKAVLEYICLTKKKSCNLDIQLHGEVLLMFLDAVYSRYTA